MEFSNTRSYPPGDQERAALLTGFRRQRKLAGTGREVRLGAQDRRSGVWAATSASDPQRVSGRLKLQNLDGCEEE